LQIRSVEHFKPLRKNQ